MSTIQVKITVMDTVTRTFAPCMYIQENVKKGKLTKEQIQSIKDRAIEKARLKSGLGRFERWSFRAYLMKPHKLHMMGLQRQKTEKIRSITRKGKKELEMLAKRMKYNH